MLTPMKAIRAKCLDCSCGSANEVKHCPITNCPLFPYRSGKNPNARRERTAVQREATEKLILSRKMTAYLVKKTENSVTEGTDTPATENAAKRPVSPA